MADKFSAQWWNDQASTTRLTKAVIESLTGQDYATRWNSDGSIASFWYTDVIARAPGFATAGLLLDPGSGQGTRDVMANVGSPNWGDWAFFKSPVGNVAPGATDAYNPTLSEVYTPPAISGPLPVNPTTAITGTPSALPPTVVDVTKNLSNTSGATQAPTLTVDPSTAKSKTPTPTSLLPTDEEGKRRMLFAAVALVVLAVVLYQARK